MATGPRCSRCDELWCAYASATREHLLAVKEQESAGAASPKRIRQLQLKVESTGAERAAARVKITTHLALSHSRQVLGIATGAASH